MKQKITFKLCLAMLGLLLSFSAGAANYVGHIVIEQLKYTLYDDGTASVAAADKSTISGEIVIPASVEDNNKTYSVTTIGYNAFSSCSKLTAITIPNSVTTIGEGAFERCSGLTAITIPNSVTTIGNNAFYDCYSLKEFIVATDNPNYSSLDGILYNKQQTEIIQAPEAIRSVTIPNSVTTIGDWAFRDCRELTAITIPNSVTTIGVSAFDGCYSLTAITIPNSVKTIGKGAFNGCSGLKEFIVAKDNPNYSSLDGILYNKQQTEIIQAFQTIRSVNIPNSVTTIGEGAFQSCRGLTAITIPNSVTTIGNNAFYGCRGLTAITIGNSVTTIGEGAFQSCSKLTAITIPNSVTTIGNNAFYGCRGLTAITIPNSVTTIGNNAFGYCSGLTAITIPNSVTTIGNYAFSSCYGLTAITIPNSVTTIGENAFNNCSELTTITIPNSVKTIGNSAFGYCSKLQEIKVYIEEPIDIDSEVFGNVDYSTCKLYVPKGSIDKYKAANIWKLFSNISALADGSAIEGVDEDKLNVYSVDGKVVIKNLREGEAISICNTTGQNVYQGNETEVQLNKGIYFVKVGTIVSKVMVQ